MLRGSRGYRGADQPPGQTSAVRVLSGLLRRICAGMLVMRVKGYI
jgi:hypothetical protein